MLALLGVLCYVFYLKNRNENLEKDRQAEVIQEMVRCGKSIEEINKVIKTFQGVYPVWSVPGHEKDVAAKKAELTKDLIDRGVPIRDVVQAVNACYGGPDSKDQVPPEQP
jgi:hypothetical protein